jgi:hypothetical protein
MFIQKLDDRSSKTLRRPHKLRIKMPGTFRAYMESIQDKSGKTPEDFWKLANKKGFVKRGEITAKHADLLAWLKSDIGLGHVHANMIITYLRLRTNDPQLTATMKRWAYSTGYQEQQLT